MQLERQKLYKRNRIANDPEFRERTRRDNTAWKKRDYWYSKQCKAFAKEYFREFNVWLAKHPELLPPKHITVDQNEIVSGERALSFLYPDAPVLVDDKNYSKGGYWTGGRIPAT